jgi:glutamine synthetase
MAMKNDKNNKKEKTPEELLKELSKTPEESFGYLKQGRAYRTEKDVFDDFTDEERELYFGVAPENVYENVKAFRTYPEKLEVLKRNGIFSEQIIDSYEEGLMYKWYTEINHRIIPNFISEIRSFKKLHQDGEYKNDSENWQKVEKLRISLMKDTDFEKGLFNLMRDALEREDYENLSNLQKTMYSKMNNLRDAYKNYKDNLLDMICQ